MKRLLFFIVLIVYYLSLSLFAQSSSFQRLSIHQDSSLTGFIHRISEDSLLLIFIPDTFNPSTSNRIFYISYSTDNGFTWSQPKVFRDDSTNFVYDYQVTSIRTLSKRILIAYTISNTIYVISSPDNGKSWTTPQALLTGHRSYRLQLSQTLDGTIYICLNLNYPELYYFKSTNDGLTWSSLIQFPESGYFLTINSINQNRVIALIETGTSSNRDIFYMTSTDNGITWSQKQPLVNSSLSEEKPMFLKTKDDKIFVFYNVSKPTPFSNIKQYDIHYSVSEDEGLTWTHHQFTRYVGDDQIVSITDSGNNPLLLILTKRFSPILKNQLGIGVVGLVKDSIAPPVIFKTEITKSMPKDPIYV